VPDLLRIFLDANILFSASYKADHRFLDFWRLLDVVPLVSMYVADETRMNCIDARHLARLEGLLQRTHFVSDPLHARLPAGINLPAKDQPVLAAAITSNATHLITGDKNHFGRWMRIPILTGSGVLTIIEPAPFLDAHLDRL
jgi:uncharacterized protein